MRKPPKPNKTAILLLSLLAAFAVLLSLYLAVLLPYFSDTGEGGGSTSVSTEPGESAGITGSTLLLFPRVQRTDMESLSVSLYNKETGAYESYTFLRDNEDADGDGDTFDFIIKEFPAHPYDEERFSALVVGAGYASCVGKLSELDFTDKSESEITAIYENYGLADADHPNSYTLTTTEGEIYTVYIGEKTPDGNYYARLDGREAVYILPASSLQESVLCPLTYFAEPRLTFEADTQYGYIYIENFSIYHDRSFLDAFFGGEEKKPELSALSPYVMFTYLRLPERDLYHSGSIYGMLAPTTAYTPHDNNVDAALQLLPGMTGTEVLKMGLSAADFAEGGLLENVAYTIYYEMPYGISYDVNQDPIVDYWVKNVLFVTRRAADGSYTVGSLSYREGEDGSIEVFYNMIAKVEKDTLSFLEYSLVDWIEPRMFSVSIDNVAAIEISSARGDYWYEITGDGTAGQVVTEKHSGKTYFYVGRDVPFELNKDGYCEDIEQFRNLYMFLLELQYQGAIADDVPLSEEEKNAIMADDSRCLLSFVLTMEDGREMTYRFFPYSERHSMVSISGDGIPDVTVFYTLTASIRRIADATWQLANGVYIDPDFRYQD